MLKKMQQKKLFLKLFIYSRAMRSALAARMYAAVQLSSQQQQMYVNIYKKREKMQLIIYQRFIKKMKYESCFLCRKKNKFWEMKGMIWDGISYMVDIWIVGLIFSVLRIMLIIE